ncbi:MAG: hypothetical protein AB7V43_18810 [Acidimicrobiia bacterium]
MIVGLQQEARLADELVCPLRCDAVHRVAAIVDLVLLVVIGLLVVGCHQSVFEDGVEVGLDVVGVDDVLIVVLFLGAGRSGHHARASIVDIDVVLVVGEGVVVIEDERIIFVEILRDLVFVEILRHLVVDDLLELGFLVLEIVGHD